MRRRGPRTKETAGTFSRLCLCCLRNRAGPGRIARAGDCYHKSCDRSVRRRWRWRCGRLGNRVRAFHQQRLFPHGLHRAHKARAAPVGDATNWPAAQIIAPETRFRTKDAAALSIGSAQSLELWGNVELAAIKQNRIRNIRPPEKGKCTTRLCLFPLFPDTQSPSGVNEKPTPNRLRSPK